MVVYPSQYDFSHMPNGAIFKPKVTAQPAGGTFLNAQSVTLTTDVPATIYFTTDNSLPTASSPRYSTLINIASNTTLKFFAIDSYGNQSDIQTETYTVQSVGMTAGNINVVQGEMRQTSVTLTSVGSFNESMNMSYAYQGNVPTGATVNIDPGAVTPTRRQFPLT